MKRGFGKGRSETKFSYTYKQIAEAIGCTPAAARKHAQRGNYNPGDLLSVLEFVRDRLQTRDRRLDEHTSRQVLGQLNEIDNKNKA